MPFKQNAARRHRSGKMKFKVTNWVDTNPAFAVAAVWRFG